MALIVNDRVRETTSVVGTGAATLLGPITGYQAFSVIGNSNTTYYCIADQVGSNWEVGIGTYASAGNTITRTTVLASSNSGALVSFTAGTKDIFLTYPSEKAVYQDASNQVTLASQLNLTNASNYNLYASGAGDNYLAGSLGLGIVSNTQSKLIIGGTYPSLGGVTQVLNNTGTIPSTTTTVARIYASQPITQATSFNLLSLIHYYASPQTFGAGSAITSQYGFLADSSLTGATNNNYGFYGNIAAGTGRYNLYMNGTADNYLAGSLGVGGTDARAMVNVGGSIVTGTGIEYFRAGGTSPSTATAYIIPFHSEVTTPASATTFAELTSFKAQPSTTGANSTITLLQGFAALGATLGATSTITNQYGYFAAASLTAAANNYGFYGNIAAGTNRYNLYMGGTADNYLAGSLGIGTSSLGSYKLSVSGSASRLNNTDIDGSSIEINAGGTGNRFAYIDFHGDDVYTDFALRILRDNFGANSNSVITHRGTGALSIVTVEAGPVVFSTTNTERMRIDSVGNVGIGSAPYSSTNLLIAKNITGATSMTPVLAAATIQSDVTTSVQMFATFSSTAATAFTLGALTHFNAAQGTIGATSSITSQYGFAASSTLTGATNNYGFFSNIAAGAGRYNLFMNGTADNYLAGKTGFGSTSLGGVFGHVSNQLTLSGAIDCVAYGAINTINSDVTNSATIYKSQPATQAASFILPTLIHFSAQQYTIGAGSAITNQYGFLADSSLTNATNNNQGFRGNIAAGTNRYNLYMSGTATNYLAGDLQLAKTVTAAGTTGAQTINKTTGTVNFAAGAASLVVTNSLVTANSIIIATVGTNDTTMKSVAVVAGAGSFTLHANAAATAETRVNFLITN